MHQSSIMRTYQETLQRRHPVPMTTVLLCSSPWQLLPPPKISYFGIFIVMPSYYSSKARISINSKHHTYTSLSLVLCIISWSPSANSYSMFSNFLLPHPPQLPPLLSRTTKHVDISLETWWMVTSRHTMCVGSRPSTSPYCSAWVTLVCLQIRCKSLLLEVYCRKIL